MHCVLELATENGVLPGVATPLSKESGREKTTCRSLQSETIEIGLTQALRDLHPDHSESYKRRSDAMPSPTFHFLKPFGSYDLALLSPDGQPPSRSRSVSRPSIETFFLGL